MAERIPIEQRYWSKVDTSAGPDGCWPWTGAKIPFGHGTFWDGTYDAKGQGRKAKAHRWAYERFIGPIPPGLFVCHTCDNPPCQNPRHWFLGTPGDNARDCRDKGRSHGFRTKGEANPQAKLTAGQVIAIRAEYATGDISQARLAAKYGVTQGLVGQVVRRRVWKHVA